MRDMATTEIPIWLLQDYLSEDHFSSQPRLFEVEVFEGDPPDQSEPGCSHWNHDDDDDDDEEDDNMPVCEIGVVSGGSGLSIIESNGRSDSGNTGDGAGRDGGNPADGGESDAENADGGDGSGEGNAGDGGGSNESNEEYGGGSNDRNKEDDGEDQKMYSGDGGGSNEGDEEDDEESDEGNEEDCEGSNEENAGDGGGSNGGNEKDGEGSNEGNAGDGGGANGENYGGGSNENNWKGGKGSYSKDTGDEGGCTSKNLGEGGGSNRSYEGAGGGSDEGNAENESNFVYVLNPDNSENGQCLPDSAYMGDSDSEFDKENQVIPKPKLSIGCLSPSDVNQPRPEEMEWEDPVSRHSSTPIYDEDKELALILSHEQPSMPIAHFGTVELSEVDAFFNRSENQQYLNNEAPTKIKVSKGKRSRNIPIKRSRSRRESPPGVDKLELVESLNLQPTVGTPRFLPRPIRSEPDVMVTDEVHSTTEPSPVWKYDSQTEAIDASSGGPIESNYWGPEREPGYIIPEREPASSPVESNFIVPEREPGYLVQEREPGYIVPDREPDYIVTERESASSPVESAYWVQETESASSAIQPGYWVQETESAASSLITARPRMLDPYRQANKKLRLVAERPYAALTNTEYDRAAAMIKQFYERDKVICLDHYDTSQGPSNEHSSLEIFEALRVLRRYHDDSTLLLCLGIDQQTQPCCPGPNGMCISRSQTYVLDRNQAFCQPQYTDPHSTVGMDLSRKSYQQNEDSDDDYDEI